jgi:hypothetical protein
VAFRKEVIEASMQIRKPRLTVLIREHLNSLRPQTDAEGNAVQAFGATLHKAAAATEEL